jgi:hypothetical protein
MFIKFMQLTSRKPILQSKIDSKFDVMDPWKS